MTSQKYWKLKHEDGSLEEFMDLRRKVGNRVLRAYLLETISDDERVERITISVRGPKDEFKDSAKFLVLKAFENKVGFRILVEAGVYENLRIVGTDSQQLAEKEPDEIIGIFTDALKNLEDWNTSIVISNDSMVKLGKK
ncbi:MAG: hypothetical protein ACTSU3_07285 [Candidatus Thorarchaeota archaeon]